MWVRRIIYLAVFLAVTVPLVFRLTIRPARLTSAEQLYSLIENLDDGIALLAFDFGPSTKAENESQAEVVLEHLLRRKIPVALFSLVATGEPFLEAIPKRIVKRLKAEQPGLSLEYGSDWVNLGYRPGMSLFIQALAKSNDLSAFFTKDAYGSNLKNLPFSKNLKSLKDINLVVEFTGLNGLLGPYIQFLQHDGYSPPLGHGCTSITIPEAYIYLDSGQLKGLLEGLSGAAWYSELLREQHPKREPDSALVTNTALGIAQLLILILIAVGNLGVVVKRFGSRRS